MKTIALLGQSLATDMFRIVDSTPAPTPRVNTKMWIPASSAWGTPTGVGAITLCNDLGAILAAAGPDDEVRIYDCGAGGSSIGYWANPSDNHWGSGGTARNAALAQVAAAGVVPDIAIMWQGWQDYLCPYDTATIKTLTAAGFTDLYSALKTAWGSGLLFDLWPPGRCNYPAPASATAPHVQGAQMNWALATSGAALGHSNYDMPLRDGVHGTGVGYATTGHRGAIDLGARLGVPGYETIAMPRMTGGSRSGSTCILDTNVAGELEVPDKWDTLANISYMTGFFVWDTAWSIVPIVGVRPLGNQVRLDLAWTTGAHIAYQRGIDGNINRPIYTTIKGVKFPLASLPDENVIYI